MAVVFFSYSHADEALRDQLEKHLSAMKRQGLIATWHDRRISAGAHLDHAIAVELERADVVLLLVSADFLASDYCNNVELRRAMERHEEGSCRVIPVILRHCDWHEAAFGKLNATPKDGKPIKAFSDLDEAFLQVVQAIKAALPRAPVKGAPAQQVAPEASGLPQTRHGVRSSNLGLPRKFTDADRDAFLDETFDFVAEFFANSIKELQERHPGVRGRFSRIDLHRFTATAYADGKTRSFCHIFRGHRSRSIAYSTDEHLGTNSYNEELTIESDRDRIFLRPLGMALRRPEGEQLTAEAAAEAYWGLFLEPLQR